MPPINLLTTVRVDWFSNPMFYKFHSSETKNKNHVNNKKVDFKLYDRRKNG